MIDEADRVMEDIQNDWLQHLENAVYSGQRSKNVSLNVESCSRGQLPLQKLLFSATLSHNPEQLQELNLFEPKLFSSMVKPDDILHNESNSKSQFFTPKELKQYCLVCKDSLKKPLVLHDLIQREEIKKALIFTKSVEHTHLLVVFLQKFGHKVAELSSKVRNIFPLSISIN